MHFMNLAGLSTAICAQALSLQLFNYCCNLPPQNMLCCWCSTRLCYCTKLW